MAVVSEERVVGDEFGWEDVDDGVDGEGGGLRF